MQPPQCRQCLVSRGQKHVQYSRRTFGLLSELTEVFPAVVCCVVSTSYVHHDEQPQTGLDRMNISPLFSSTFLQEISGLPRFGFLTNPSAGTMLGSCLVLGCCLSSFCHRRQDHDRYQALVFVTLAVWVAVLGRGLGASANMISLGFVPWALCAAMLLSAVGHWFVRWLVGRGRYQTEAVAVLDIKTSLED